MAPAPESNNTKLASVLSEIADLARGLDLAHGFHRVAVSVRGVIPFETMTVVHLADGERVAVHAATAFETNPDGEPFTLVPLTDWSPRWRPRSGPCPRIALDSVERDLIDKALTQSKGNKARAARLLGLSRAQLYSRLAKHGFR